MEVSNSLQKLGVRTLLSCVIVGTNMPYCIINDPTQAFCYAPVSRERHTRSACTDLGTRLIVVKLAREGFQSIRALMCFNFVMKLVLSVQVIHTC